MGVRLWEGAGAGGSGSEGSGSDNSIQLTKILSPLRDHRSRKLNTDNLQYKKTNACLNGGCSWDRTQHPDLETDFKKTGNKLWPKQAGPTIKKSVKIDMFLQIQNQIFVSGQVAEAAHAGWEPSGCLWTPAGDRPCPPGPVTEKGRVSMD